MMPSKESHGLFSAYCHDSLSEGFEAAEKNVTPQTGTKIRGAG